VDDIIIIGATKEECQQRLDKALRTLRTIGFPVADSKVVRPTQCAEYLGITIDTVGCELRISDERQVLLKSEVRAVLQRGRGHKKEMQSLLGKLSWCAGVMPGARAFMRRLWYFLATLPSRGRRRLTPGALEDLHWWQQHLNDPGWTGSRIWPSDDELPIVIEKSDASGDVGCGFHHGNVVRTFTWTDEQRQHSIAWKELYPLLLAAQEFGPQWANKIVRCGVDNTSVVYMINSGSAAQPDCAKLLRQIAHLEAKYKFSYVASWVPREFNIVADTASRDLLRLAQEQLRSAQELSRERAASPA